MRASRDDLRALSKDVLYEIQMLFRTSAQLQALDSRNAGVAQEIVMALIESCALHARALIHFLWREGAHKEDGFAADYFEPGRWAALRPPKESTIIGVDDRVGGEIAHLSYKRTRLTAD